MATDYTQLLNQHTAEMMFEYAHQLRWFMERNRIPFHWLETREGRERIFKRAYSHHKAEWENKAREKRLTGHYPINVLTRAPRRSGRVVGRRIDFRAFLADRVPMIADYNQHVIRSQADVVRAITNLANSWSVWIRDLTDFRPQTQSRRPLIDQLIHHLVGVHEGPSSLYDAWMHQSYNRCYQDAREAWALASQGRSLRRHLGIPRPVANRLWQDSHLQPHQVVAWAYCKEIGLSDEASQRLAEVLADALPNPVGRMPMVLISFLRRFAAGEFPVEPDTMDAVRHLAQWHDAFTPQEVSRISIPRLLARIETHRLALEQRYAAPINWTVDAGKAVLLWNEHGPAKDPNEELQSGWRFVPLESSLAIKLEGEAMRNCLRHGNNYTAQQCATGIQSIWSLRRIREGIEQRMATFTVARERTLLECRGPCNGTPDPQVRAIIKKWLASW